MAVGKTIDSVRLVAEAPAHYAARLASTKDEVWAAQALRFEVFNLELNEGLEQSFTTGLDEDPFDAVCDHLVVEYVPSKQIVGTYRLQSGRNAQACLGYYSEQEFEFETFERLRTEIVEAGRACVHRQHRNLVVLGLLWKGIAEYAQRQSARYLLGCSSISSQDPSVGASTYAQLCRRHLAAPEYRTRPRPEFECALDRLAAETPPVPKLLRAYLTIGAKICGPPALDRHFKTIDFLTMVELVSLPVPVRQRFMTSFEPKRPAGR